MTVLDELRTEIRSIDRQIMELFQRRIQTAKIIGEYKRENQLAVRNYQIEHQILSRARSLATQLGIRPELAQNLSEILIKGAVENQLGDVNKTYINNTRVSCLVIGGKGKMGSWLSQFLSSSGNQVEIEEEGDEIENYHIFDLIFIATPMDVVPKILDKMEKIQPPGIIVDISSLKSHIVDNLYRLANIGLNVTSIHPMFGPDVNMLSGRNLLIASLGNKEADKTINQLFADTALQIETVSIEDHDRYMAVSLGLSHAINVLFGMVISKSGIDHDELRKTASTTFMKQFRTTQEVFLENPDLYYQIQHYNNHRDTLYKYLSEAIEELYTSVKQSDSDQFEMIMKTGNQLLGGKII